MNLIIIILAGIAAYIIACLFQIADGAIAKWELRREERKRLSSELYRFQLKQLYLYCLSHYIESGYSTKQASELAVSAVVSMDKNFLVESKYKLLRETQNGYIRNTRSSS